LAVFLGKLCFFGDGEREADDWDDLEEAERDLKYFNVKYINTINYQFLV
jgi:hypothetical protein